MIKLFKMEEYILDANDKLHVKISLFIGIAGLIASIILKEVAPMPIWLSMFGFGSAAATYRLMKKNIGEFKDKYKKSDQEACIKIGLFLGISGLIVAILLRDFGGVTSWISLFALSYGINTAYESALIENIR
jgi:hypothetical protein